MLEIWQRGSNSQHYGVREGRGTCMIIKKKESLQFDNEQSIHMSSEYDEEIGYGVDVDLLNHLVQIVLFTILGKVGV